MKKQNNGLIKILSMVITLFFPSYSYQYFSTGSVAGKVSKLIIQNW